VASSGKQASKAKATSFGVLLVKSMEGPDKQVSETMRLLSLRLLMVEERLMIQVCKYRSRVSAAQICGDWFSIFNMLLLLLLLLLLFVMLLGAGVIVFARAELLV
jgi:hypothetical protein